jgi:protein-S-isoprenylcysteine O-methyltransferase Ste14
VPELRSLKSYHDLGFLS